MKNARFMELSGGFFVSPDFADAFAKVNLTSIDAVFNFEGGQNMNKANLAKHRTRIRFEIDNPPATVFLKRYDNPPRLLQISNWLSHLKRAATGDYDRLPAAQLLCAGINTPEIIAYGSQWNGLFEKRSFIITKKIPDAESLERKPPDFFCNSPPTENIAEKRQFIDALADFAKRFHQTGLRHRDFYTAHIFRTDKGRFYLIDLHRTFKPLLLARRFQIKDITQLYYSAPGQIFSRADRLRFYKQYTGRKKLTRRDRIFIRKLKARAWRMADHDIKHGRQAPFAM
jgi:heptose I phosphotransferase